MFRDSIYQILTLLTPFAFVEFLHIKYEKVFLPNEYYLIFLVLSLLAILHKVQTVRNQTILKLVVAVLTVFQLYTGFVFLQNSSIKEERDFATLLLDRAADRRQDQNRDLANYINHLPKDSHVLVDDAIAYPVVAYIDHANFQKLTLPYEETVFLSAIEAPDKYDDYILLATPKNEVTGFTQLNDKFVGVAKKANSALIFRRVFETDDWVLYKVFDN
jgi:hypothetical protein